jgi:hypothetical protein
MQVVDEIPLLVVAAGNDFHRDQVLKWCQCKRKRGPLEVKFVEIISRIQKEAETNV